MLSLVAAPPEGPKPDEFYAAVADVYGRAAVQSATPAVAVAEANGVEAATVRAWVREARRRGLMPAGRKGAA
jgi:transposase-like protein